MASPFDFVNALYDGKDPLKDQPDSRELKKAYVPFLINRALSYNIATLFYVDDLNMYPNIDHRQHWDYYKYSVKPGKRSFSAWAKPDNSDDVMLVSEYYGYSLAKAREALSLLSMDDLIGIRERMKKGGQEGGQG